MAPTATIRSTFVPGGPPSSPVKRGWTEHRSEIPSILVGRGQENASTARHELEQGMDSQRRPPEIERTQACQSSLKRAKNSTDLLRERCLKRENLDGGVDASPSTREGRQFTVANVGNNGKIYLR